jgi:hypothetical protein
MQALTTKRQYYNQKNASDSLPGRLFTGKWIALSTLAALTAASIALALVWTRSVSTRMGYEISLLNIQYAELKDDNMLLRIEAQNLASPSELIRKAAQFGFIKIDSSKIIVAED